MPLADLVFSRQFLFTRERCATLGWNAVEIGDFHLYAHPYLEVTQISGHESTLVLIGYIFDHRNPPFTHADILHELLKSTGLDLFFRNLAELSGRFVLLYQTGEELLLLHDACGQREVFYDTTFSAFGSQPKIIEKSIPGQEHIDQDALTFFRSEAFLKQRIFVGDRTHRSNIRRLPPNHYIDITKKSVHRYFPVVPLEKRSTQEVAQSAIRILKGFLQAASLRYPLEVGVTAGYDSRVLFLASMDLPVIHYVGRNNGTNNRVDVEIALQLGRIHGKNIEVRDFSDTGVSEEARAVQDISIDFPRYRRIKGNQSKKMIINGNVSEIARSYFGSERHLTGAELARMCGFGDSPYVVRIYSAWLEHHKPMFDRLGYHYLDMFYWEERMGNWAAKGKTEADFTVEVYSPFNARALLQLLLATDRRHRDKQFNRLYDSIIGQMSPAALKIPVNPVRKLNAIRLLKRLRVYNLYRKYGIRWGILKR